MKVLVPCSTCRRHVRVSESACPFCGAVFNGDAGADTPSLDPRRRLGSLAVMAFRATALSAAITCGGKVEDSADTADAASEAAAGASGAGLGGSGNGGSGGTGGSSGKGGSPGTGGTSGPGGSPGTGGTSGSGNPPRDGGPVPIYRATPPG